jgi:ABC-2 type transport system permease protein
MERVNAVAATDAKVQQPASWRPPILRIGLQRGRIEVRQFFRSNGQVIATFSMPVLLLVMMASVFNFVIAGLDSQQIYVTGMLGVGVMSSSFQSMGLQVASERRSGALKRLRGTPMPPASYFAGKIIMVVVTSLVQAAIVLTLGVVFYHLRLPSSMAKWATFAWVYLLGITACTLLGIGYSTLQRDEGGAVIVLPFTLLQFLSGVFVLPSMLPTWVQYAGEVFPLAWLCKGMRSVFLPAAYARLEPGGGWEHGMTFLVLAAWAVVGLALCLKTFRWRSAIDG